MLVIRPSKEENADIRDLIFYYNKEIISKKRSLKEFWEDVTFFSKEHNLSPQVFFGSFGLHLWFVHNGGGYDPVAISYDNFVVSSDDPVNSDDSDDDIYPYSIGAKFRHIDWEQILSYCYNFEKAKRFADDIVECFPERFVSATVYDFKAEVNTPRLKKVLYLTKPKEGNKNG